MNRAQYLRDAGRVLSAVILGCAIIMAAPYLARFVDVPIAALAVEASGVTIILMALAQIVVRVAHPYVDARVSFEKMAPRDVVLFGRVFPILVYLAVLWLQISASPAA